MLNKIKFYQLFIISVLISPFLGYFFNSGIIAYGPLIISLLFIIFLELVYPSSMRKKDWIAVIIWLPYVIWAGFYYISNPFEGRYLTTHLLVIISLPFFVLSFLRLRSSVLVDYPQFIYKLIICFLIAELMICLGQMSTYILGFGLPVSEVQSNNFMIAGTFTNSNDLGGIVLLLSFIFIGIEKHLINQRDYVWFVITILLIVSGSRSALLLTFVIFILTRGLNIKNVILYSVLFIGVYSFFNTILVETDIEVVSRFSQRLDSLYNVLENGAEDDNSITLRVESYIHFIKNIGDLGLGSGEINNYFKYSDNANFPTYLIFQNPHSLIVEVGYWLGYPGLVSLIIAIFYLFQYPIKKALLFLVLSISTLIPSSVIGSLVYFLFIICVFFPPLPVKRYYF